MHGGVRRKKIAGPSPPAFGAVVEVKAPKTRKGQGQGAPKKKKTKKKATRLTCYLLLLPLRLHFLAIFWSYFLRKYWCGVFEPH
jgi:hypothetical protein